MNMEQYLDSEEQTVDEFEADLEKRVRDAVAAQFILDEVAKKEQLGVDQNELSQHIFQRAQQSGQNPDEFARHMVEHNHIPEMVSEVVRGKALATIVEAAKVTDESGSHVELKLLQPDGTIGEPEDESAEVSADEAGTGEEQKTDEA
jgi:trigger factor